MNMIALVREANLSFCREFIEYPYLCYTEHGQHARFYSRLYQSIPDEIRYLVWEGHRICVIQKEYPTADKIGKPQRQHWDISVLQSPAVSLIEGPGAFDYLRLNAVVEFALNEGRDHLIDDIERLSHPEANLEKGFIVHMYRLSEPGSLVSGRDWSPNSSRILTAENVRWLSIDKPVEIYLAVSDSTKTHPGGIWRIIDGEVNRI